MIIRKGTVSEMLTLWYRENTSEFFAQQIATGKADFWPLEVDQLLIGELYVFYELTDIDLANGKDTVYLSAFRIKKTFRGQGLGTCLMERVLSDLKKRGWPYATIGADLQETANLRLYRRLGFTTEIKILTKDYCDVDEQFQPSSCEPYLLLRKKL